MQLCCISQTLVSTVRQVRCSATAAQATVYQHEQAQPSAAAATLCSLLSVTLRPVCMLRSDHLLRHCDTGLCVVLQQALALVQLVLELVRANHLLTCSYELQEQLLRASLVFVEKAQRVHPEATQVNCKMQLVWKYASGWVPTNHPHVYCMQVSCTNQSCTDQAASCWIAQCGQFLFSRSVFERVDCLQYAGTPECFRCSGRGRTPLEQGLERPRSHSHATRLCECWLAQVPA